MADASAAQSRPNLIAQFDDLLNRTALYGPADALRDTWRQLKAALLADPGQGAPPLGHDWQMHIGAIIAATKDILEHSTGGDRTRAQTAIIRSEAQALFNLIAEHQLAALSLHGTVQPEPPQKCPRCDSPSPELHPSVQWEGEVQTCSDPWHSQPTNRTPVASRAVPPEPPQDEEFTPHAFELLRCDGDDIWCKHCEYHCEHPIHAVPGDAGIPPADPPPCEKCRGPHPFDTVIPSVQWNKVIRGAGLPDYLCATCILRAFLDAGVSFTADIDGVPLEIRIDSQDAWDATLISAENTSLRARIRELEVAARETQGATRPRLVCEECQHVFTAEQLAAEDRAVWGHPCFGTDTRPATCESHRISTAQGAPSAPQPPERTTMEKVFIGRKMSTDKVQISTFEGDVLVALNRESALRVANDILELCEVENPLNAIREIVFKTSGVRHDKPGALVTHDAFTPTCPLCREDVMDVLAAARQETPAAPPANPTEEKRKNAD